MNTKDTSHWTQLEFLYWFNRFLESEWEEFIQYAEDNGFNRAQVSILKSLHKCIGNVHKTPSYSQLRSAYSTIASVEMAKKRDEMAEKFVEGFSNSEIKHVSIRVAWHDNKWDGNVCRDPEQNSYCSGYHSLLSARLRSRKRTDLEVKYPGQGINCFENEMDRKDKKYIPPCFWSINAFGEKSLEVVHDNPILSDAENIRETLPPYSVYSWPFALSFVRDRETYKADGKYPKNLENVRIPKFQNKLQEGQTIVFLYANYDNPISADEPGDKSKYLVVGCGLLKEKGKPTRFERPQSAFETVKGWGPEYRNFPRINWALRYSLDFPDNIVRLPYHEYLQDAEKSKDYTRINQIKVTIDESALIHCFKYVAMDVDDDEAIYILTKIRQKLMIAKDHGIIDPSVIQIDIDKINRFLGLCWKRRGYFPGFEKLTRIMLDKEDDDPLSLKNFIQTLIENEGDQYADKFISLLENPSTDIKYKSFKNEILDLIDSLQDKKKLSVSDYIQLCFLNLTSYQFERVLKGDLGSTSKRNIREICQNPYLLYEEYEAEEQKTNPNTGEQIDFPIELFKIDIAFSPDTNHIKERLECQREMRKDDQRRVRALIIDYLSNLENWGHCFDSAENIQTGLKNYPLFYKIGKDYELPENFLYQLDDKYEQHLEDKLKIVLTNDNKYFYLKKLYQAEQAITSIFNKLLNKHDHKDTPESWQQHIADSGESLQAKIGDSFKLNEFKEERTALYSRIFRKNLFVLAGSAGAGKSYELLHIISLLQARGESYILLAPTGKATLRLNTDEKFPGIEAKTIDKFISEHKNRKGNSLQYNNLIVDEMSMVDLLKLDELLKYFNFDNPALKRVIFVGDRFQLPPIGFGKPYIDLISFLQTNQKYHENYIELEVNCRVTTDPILVEFSKIFTGQNIDHEELLERAAKGDLLSEAFRVLYWNSKDELFDKIHKYFQTKHNQNDSDLAQTINRLLGLTPAGKMRIDNKKPCNVDGIQLLSPYRSDFFGVTKINQKIQNDIKREAPFLELHKFSFKNGDKVIQTKNQYENEELVLSNGSMGLVLGNGSTGKFYFPEKQYIPLKSSELDEEYLELAFCITVHKAQGSGFDDVLLIVPKKQSLLCKELFYTAITRAKERLTIYLEGSPSESFEKSTLARMRSKSFVDLRKTSLMNLPYWDYSLEPEDGAFVISRAEYMIYRELMEYRKKGLTFYYEHYPVTENGTIKVKTDFTIYTQRGHIYYWEHLGLLGNRYYENKWKIKLETYIKNGLADQLITTDEMHGIAREKIKSIIEDMQNELVQNEDKYFKYSKHHYHLR